MQKYLNNDKNFKKILKRIESFIFNIELLTSNPLLSRVVFFTFLLIFATCHTASRTPTSNHQMVVTAHAEASRIGFDILDKGGNAFDAAIAVQFALAVTYPRAGNIAGGGFLVYYSPGNKSGVLDFREVAPYSGFPDFYKFENGVYNYQASMEGALSVAVPGTVDGMWQLHKKKGSLSWSALIQPAIDLAKNGVVLTAMEASHMNQYSKWIDSISNFSTPYGLHQWKPNDLFIQPELATTLETIRDHGRAGFYEGEVASKFLTCMKQHRGRISQFDLSNYQAVWRNVLEGYYGDYTILTMPPPSAGGVMLLQMLFGADQLRLSQYGWNTTAYLHHLIEIQRRVFADRAVFYGDPDFVDVPVNKLLSPVFMEKKFKDITDEKTPSALIRPATQSTIESFETTHFSIYDRYGNAVAVTTTLNSNYGSGLVVKGAGFLLNNEMNDFTIERDKPNQFGMIGGEANEIMSRKRMLSNMTPTIILKGKKVKAIVGTPGGSTISNVVMQTIMNILEFDMSMQQAVLAPKIHSQWLPDEVYYEQRISPTVIDSLSKLGHRMVHQPLGKLNCILVRPDGSLEGGTDQTKGDGKVIGN